MSERGIEIKLRINFPVILFTVLAVHVFFIGSKTLEQLTAASRNQNRDKSREPAPLRIKNIRTVGKRDGKSHNLADLLQMRRGAPVPPTFKPSAPKKSLSLADLQDNRPVVAKKQQVRPGTRPTVTKSALEKTKTLNAISLKGSQIQKFAQGENAAALSGDPRAAALNNTDVLVSLEVPEGVDPDELNKYELMFYGFQKRTATGYINSFYKHLDKFQRENPHLHFPMTQTKQTMTGRLTYDSKGNITQIKMIRWSNEDRLQDFFTEVLKEMDTLHNPPQALWEKNGEFSIFFSLVLNG